MKGCCQVCSQNQSRYRCPKCFILYCSLDCFKTHKDKCEEKVNGGNTENEIKEQLKNQELEEGEIDDDDDVEEEEEGEKSEVLDKDIVPEYLLEKLGHSKELRNQLENKHLRKMLEEIDSNKNPGEKLDEVMKIPIFTEFVTTCMGIIEPKEKR